MKDGLKTIALICLLIGWGFLASAGTPALIPTPQTIRWTGGLVDCSRYHISAPGDAGFAVAELERTLAGAEKNPAGIKITLRLGAIAGTNDEAYTLDAAPEGIVIAAPKPVGLLYGVETLRQLLAGTTRVPGCHIADEPAFAWRGFMHDVGRNFQDLALLKRFVDVMAHYKLNVFHFHLTDNPAWRVECRVHPELNDPKFTPVTRRPGKFYTYAELNDFIAYGRERGVRVVPELDMPGHSEYFQRAFGVNMQDERGMKILAECVNEFLDHVDVTELHIGSDEVALKNANFLPHMAELVRAHGKQIIVWRPGGMPGGKVMTQLWSAGGRGNGLVPGMPCLDSRDDYVNHLDPFDLPQRELNLATCGKATGDDIALGGILCHWPDNNVGEQMNVYRQSPVFPALLAAAERYWCGHTPERKEFWARLPEAGTPAFATCAEFEARMLAHRDLYFRDWPFPYVKQTDMVWKLIGPFDHQGNVNAVFPPEQEIRASYDMGGTNYTWREARGATIHVNHFWYDGWLPKTATGTAYALTYVWSPRAQTVGFWIGFNGPSRSDRRGGPNPAQGQWSTTGSRVWVNDSPLAPPVWKQPGVVKGGAETPFVDEDYFYRDPLPVVLKQGWNKILVKAPRSSTTWKWMFTCVPVAVEQGRVREVAGLRFASNPE